MKICIVNDRLKVILRWWEKFLACRGSLEVSLSNIEAVSTNLPRYNWMTIRCPGSAFPWVISAGTFYTKREKWDKEFIYWTRGYKFLVIDIKNESYRRLILGVENPDFLICEINKHLFK